MIQGRKSEARGRIEASDSGTGEFQGLDFGLILPSVRNISVYQ